MNIKIIRKIYIMEDTITYTLKKYFPFYSHPEKSRFTDLFEELSKKENSPITSTKIYKTLDIIPNEILCGHDKRTSVIIKGFPSEMRIQDVFLLLVQFTKNINFFHIPPLIREQKRYMYAFVNFTTPKSIIPLYYGLTNLRDKYKNYCGFDLKEIKIFYSKTQGQKSLIKKCFEKKSDEI